MLIFNRALGDNVTEPRNNGCRADHLLEQKSFERLVQDNTNRPGEGQKINENRYSDNVKHSVNTSTTEQEDRNIGRSDYDNHQHIASSIRQDSLSSGTVHPHLRSSACQRSNEYK